MKANSGKNSSLVDAIINSTVDSLRHEANIFNLQAGEHAQERGPTRFEFGEREEMQKMRRAMNFTEGCKVNVSDVSDSGNISSIFDKAWSQRPNKLVKKRSSGNLPPIRNKRKKSISAHHS